MAWGALLRWAAVIGLLVATFALGSVLGWLLLDPVRRDDLASVAGAGGGILGAVALLERVGSPLWFQFRRDSREAHGSRLETFAQRDGVNHRISELEDDGPHEAGSGRETELQQAIEHRAYLTSVLAQQQLLQETPPTPSSSGGEAQPATATEVSELRRLLDESRLATDILDAPGWSLRGWAFYRAERYEQALQALDRALALDDTDAETHSQRSAVLLHLERYRDGLAAADRAIALSPEHAIAISNRGIALGGLKRHEEELAAFDQAMELDPSPIHQYNRTCALSMLGRLPESIEELERALGNGYASWGLIESDDELEPLRSDPEYGPRLRELIERYKNAGDGDEDETTEV